VKRAAALAGREMKETHMLRWMTRVSCFFALVLAAGLATAQTEFSADVVDTHKQGSTTQAKIYFAKDKIRFDSLDRDPKSGGAFIMNPATQSIIIIMSQQHMYMEMPAQAGEQRKMFTFFRTTDVENACGDWLKLANNKGGSCHKIGSETVNGRSTVQYEGTNSSGETSQVWLDPKLRFPVKWQGKNGGGELHNIQEGAQPASLFEVPAGFNKMDMGGMMQRQ
jgi:hypothetical protein